MDNQPPQQRFFYMLAVDYYHILLSAYFSL